MNCPICQSTVQPGTRFCTACGASLASAQAAVAYQAPAVVEPIPGQTSAVVVVPAAKTKGTALAIEAVAAIFGIFGIGWLYSGNTAIGILLLIAGFVWDAIALFVLLVSLGFGLFCLVPIHMLLVLGSVLLLNIAAPKTA